MTDGWHTLAELDRAAARAKGTAFRAFKALAPALAEGRDVRVLRPETDAAAIAALRADGRLYAASRVAILLSAEAARRVRERMDAPA